MQTHRSRADHRPPHERVRQALLACCMAGVALGLLLLPGLALSATTTQIFPSFAGGKLGKGTTIHFRFAVTESSGGIPQAPIRAVIHLPKGTGLGFTRLPKADLCSYNTLIAAGYGVSACPKGSRAGPVGSAHLEAIVGGRPTIVKARLYPVIVGLHGGGRALALLLESPAPFPTSVLSLLPYKGELVMSLGAIEVSPGERSAIIDLSITLGGGARITMPASCPKGGFRWRTDFSYWEGPDTTALATSPCPGKGIRASTQPTHSTTTSQVAQIAQAPTTAFQCEKRFHSSQRRVKCFSQLPGVNCKHPLIAEKAGLTTRGEFHYYFKLKFREETRGQGTAQYGSEQYYSYAPANKNIAICPYPGGAVYKVSLQAQKVHCGRIHGEEICSSEYGTKNIPEPTTSTGGHFHYYMTAVPIKSWHLVVKGYFIHPPWARRG